MTVLSIHSMPRYRAQDFLAEAQRQTSVFLSCYLVAVPIHLETVDRYAHNGAFVDSSFKQPWLYAEDMDGLAFSCDVTDGIKECETAYLNFSGKKLLLEEFNADDEVVFIPSSNPNSPSISTQECRQLHRGVIPENDSDGAEFVDINQFEPNRQGSRYLLELPELLPPTDSNDTGPGIEQLCLHLKKKQVKDPFLSASGVPITQSIFSSKDQKPVFDVEEIPEEIKEDSTLEIPTKEDFVGKQIDEDSFMEDALNATPEAGPGLPTTETLSTDLKLEIMKDENDDSIIKEFRTLRDNGNKCVKVGCEMLLTKQKTNVEKETLIWNGNKTPSDATSFITEVPSSVTIGSTPPPRLPSPFDDPSKVTLFDLDWKEDKNIVSQETVSRVSKQQWNDEKYFGAVSSWLVKEPSVEPASAVNSAPLQVELIKELDVTTDETLVPTIQDTSSEGICRPNTASIEKSWKRHVEKFHPFEDAEHQCGAIDVSQIRVDWRDPDPMLTKVPLNALSDLKAAGFTKTPRNTQEQSASSKSISSKIAGMLKQSKAAMIKQSEVLTGDIQVQHHSDNNEEGHEEKKLKIENGTSVVHVDDEKFKMEDIFLSPQKTDIKITLGTTGFQHAGEKPTLKKPEKRKSCFGDPLSDFLFLSGLPSFKFKMGHGRETGQFTDGKKNVIKKEEVTLVKEEDQMAVEKTEKGESIKELTPSTPAKEPEVIPVETEEPDTQKPERNPSKSKSKTKVVTVKIPDYFKIVLDTIKEFGSPILKQLQIEGDISPTFMFSSLIPDIIGDIIKQEFESTKRRLKQESNQGKVLCLVQLYICLSTREAAVHCDLSSALQGLSVMLQKYSYIIQGSLDAFQAKLKQVDAALKGNSQEHPKIAEMTRQISFWLTRKLLKSGDDQDLKVLVILKRDSASLAENMVSSLNTIDGIKAVSLEPSLPASPNTTSKALDSHNCLLVVASQLAHDFLWAQFSLVVEYDCTDGPSIWQNLCIRQKIRHLGLKIESDEPESSPSKDDTVDSKTEEEPLKLLCSPKVTEDSQLLHLLESKYNVVILERNYDNIIALNSPAPYADVIVDVVTGIILVTSEDILSAGAEVMMRRINSLSQQYEKIWLLVRDKSEEKSGLQSKTFRKCICQLYSAIAQYTKKEHQYEVKVLIASSLQELAELIDMVCKNAEVNMGSVWHKDDWRNRQCITVQPSKHEAFLIQFPSINSFTAQVLLTFAPLKKLLSSTSADLAILAPWVPVKFLKIFDDYAHCSFDVGGLVGGPNQGDISSDDSSNISLSQDRSEDTYIKGQSAHRPISPHDESIHSSTVTTHGHIRDHPRAAAAGALSASGNQVQHSSLSTPIGQYDNIKPAHGPRDVQLYSDPALSMDSVRDLNRVAHSGYMRGTDSHPNIVSSTPDEFSKYDMHMKHPFDSRMENLMKNASLMDTVGHGAMQMRNLTDAERVQHASLLAYGDPQRHGQHQNISTSNDAMVQHHTLSTEDPRNFEDKTALELLDTDGYGDSVDPLMHQVPVYSHHGNVQGRVQESSLQRRDGLALQEAAEMIQRTGYEGSNDPFLRIKEDCLRRMHTQSRAPPPLVVRDTGGQQRSVVRPFHQVSHRDYQTQGYQRVEPQPRRGQRRAQGGSLFDETGWKRHQPAPSAGRGTQRIQHPPGLFEETAAASRQRRLAYQKDPMSADGQTKLTFL